MQARRHHGQSPPQDNELLRHSQASRRKAQDTCLQRVTPTQAHSRRTRCVPGKLVPFGCSASKVAEVGEQCSRSQRKTAAASSGAQTTKDGKGRSRQMITLAFLEEGGYFDVPIQVKVFPECFPAAPSWYHCCGVELTTQNILSWCRFNRLCCVACSPDHRFTQVIIKRLGGQLFPSLCNPLRSPKKLLVTTGT